MKQTRLVKILAAGVACAAAFGIALAQETTTTTTTDPVTGTTTSATTTTTGTITAYTPDSDYFTDVAPVRYYYTRDTTILDPEGQTVAWSAIRPDMPATVYSTNVGDRVVVSRVVLSQPAAVYEKKETTTTTTKP